MSAPEPIGYQAEAIEKIASQLALLRDKDQSKSRLIVFKSPTGSGKTLMTAYSLAKAAANPAVRPFIVLWLSPGKGDLHKQSAKKLMWLLENTSLTVRLLDSREDIVRFQDVPEGSLFVVNWEKLRTEKAGEWANKMLAPGETANFFTLLSNASSKGLDMVAVIDESHTNLTGPQTEKLMAAIREMRPFIQLEASATPNTNLDEDLREEGYHHRVRVKFNDVVDAGMIRKSVLLNDGFIDLQQRYPAESLDVQVLWAAWERIEALRAGFLAEGSAVEPLLLIQYPDGDDAKARAEVVERFLEQRGLAKGETYAVWLSGEHSDDLENIAENDSPYKALIFKQAIATGWDCPRAQVLVQFRDPRSQTFQIQTLGRILRSPEQKHYENEALNVAYVFSDLPNASVNVITDEPDAPIRDLTIIRGDVYPPYGLALTSVFQPRMREFHYPSIENLEPALFAQLEASIRKLVPAQPFTESPSTILVDAKVETRDIVEGMERQFEGSIVEATLGERFVQALYDRLIVERIGQYRSREQSRSRVKTTIAKWFRGNFPDWQPDEIQHFALRNQDEMILAINAACEASMVADEAAAVAAARAKRRTTDKWEVPAVDLVASQDTVPAGAGYLYPGGKLGARSKPEEQFERWLVKYFEDGHLKWWWRNGVRDEKYLGIEYQYDEGNGKSKDRIHYPDYLVQLANGDLWVFEVKDVDDPEGGVDGKTHCKSRGLKSWAQSTNAVRESDPKLSQLPNVRAGVVVPEELPTQSIVVRIGDPDAWQPPTPANLAAEVAWTRVELA